MPENKVSIIMEAFNRTGEAFKSLSTSFKDALKDSDNFKLKVGELEGAFKSLVGAAALYKIGSFLKESIDTAEKMENSLRGLAATSRYSGENIGKSIQAGADIASDGLVNIQASSQALQNLLSRGYSLQESIKIIERLKDAAAFNRQSHLSMSEAVVSATEGLKNENSILVDNAGVTKNISIMWKEYAASVGKGVNELSQAEKRQAEFNGIMRETEGQLGNARLASEGLTGSKARLSTEVIKLKVAIGESLTPAFIELAKAGTWVMDKFIKPFLGGLEISATRVAMWWEKIGVIIDEYRNSRNVAGIPIDMDLSRIKKRLKELDKAFDEQAGEITKKYMGAVDVPNIGKDSGKRRTDAGSVDTKEGDKAAKEAVKLAEEKARLIADIERETRINQAGDAQEWVALAEEYNRKEVEFKKAGITDMASIREWYLSEASILMEKETAKASEEAAKQHDKEVEALFESNEAIAEHYQKLADEREKDAEKSKKSWTDGMQDFQASLSAVSSGSLAQIAGIFREQLTDAASSLEPAFTSAGEMLKGKIDGAVAQFSGWVSNGIGGAVGEQIGGVVSKIGGYLGGIASSFISGIGKGLSFVLENLGAVIEFITNIEELPGKLKESIAGLVKGARQIGSAFGQIIREIVPQLPSIFVGIVQALIEAVPEIIDALIDALPSFIRELMVAAVMFMEQMVIEVPKMFIALIAEIPRLVEALVSGLWEGLKAILFGGEIGSAVDSWAEEASTVTVELDTTNAMNALQYAQDALLGALNETDREVARQALLSAREAAILAEQQASSTDSSTSTTSEFEGIFSMFGDWISELWDGIVTALGDFVGQLWDWILGLGDFVGELWSWITGLGNTLFGWAEDAWSGLSETLSGFIDDLWETLTAWIEDLKTAISDVFSSVGDALGLDFSFGLGGLSTGNDLLDYVTNPIGAGLNDLGDSLGISWHSGGYIPKFHVGGLAADEVPAILQTGEYVVSRKGVAALDAINSGNIGGGSITQQITQNITLDVVTDRDGNILKMTKSQGKKFLRGLKPAMEDLLRNGELAFA